LIVNESDTQLERYNWYTFKVYHLRPDLPIQEENTTARLIFQFASTHNCSAAHCDELKSEVENEKQYGPFVNGLTNELYGPLTSEWKSRHGIR
jgi:hypothetical protein